ncbi:glycosyl transferase family protein [Radiomyces spectabilis]|uniref:glycosyl transferase family protein n=1 Tax=Radiomyces spectabilis TaxID=64574 RepID=UPI00221E523F|nr:glycosyl transferase family protein [Radiomyces spectabilis]KAI8373039.1 glycosyl transferase family protein [Radiomyces spectabilis]
MVNKKYYNAAWVIVLTSTNQYVQGAITLAHSLRKVGSSYPLLVLHTPAVTKPALKLLRQAGCQLRPIDPIRPPGKVHYFTARFEETWTKLAVWAQDDFRRLVLMDADMLACQNMDELMTMPLDNEDCVAAAHACTCNPQHIKAYPSDWIPANCAYTDFSTDGSADTPPLTKRDYFNSGLVVLNPSRTKFQEMMARLYAIDDLTIYPFPDQDFLNEIFKDRWKPLPYTYNALKTLSVAHSTMWHMKQVKNVHYILSKPWDECEKMKEDDPYYELYSLWQRTHNEALAA